MNTLWMIGSEVKMDDCKLKRMTTRDKRMVLELPTRRTVATCRLEQRGDALTVTVLYCRHGLWMCRLRYCVSSVHRSIYAGVQYAFFLLRMLSSI